MCWSYRLGVSFKSDLQLATIFHVAYNPPLDSAKLTRGVELKGLCELIRWIWRLAPNWVHLGEGGSLLARTA